MAVPASFLESSPRLVDCSVLKITCGPRLRDRGRLLDLDLARSVSLPLVLLLDFARLPSLSPSTLLRLRDLPRLPSLGPLLDLALSPTSLARLRDLDLSLSAARLPLLDLVSLTPSSLVLLLDLDLPRVSSRSLFCCGRLFDLTGLVSLSPPSLVLLLDPDLPRLSSRSLFSCVPSPSSLVLLLDMDVGDSSRSLFSCGGILDCARLSFPIRLLSPRLFSRSLSASSSLF